MQSFSTLLILLFLAIASPISSSALAQTAPPPSQGAQTSACGKATDSRDKLSAAKVDETRSDPQNLLKHNQIGGFQLSDEVKELATRDPAAGVDALLDAARSSNSMQAAAIGTGLGEAVKAMMAVNSACAREISRKIAKAGLSAVLSGYKLAQANTPALPTGTDGGGGGGFGGVVSASNTANSTSTGSSVEYRAASTGGSGATTSAGGSMSTNTTSSPESLSLSGSLGGCMSSVSPRRGC